MGLLRSEVLRLRSRRVVAVLVVLVVAGILLGCIIAAANSHPESANPLRLAQLPDFLKGTAFILIVVGLMIGASSVGADWQTGAMVTLLTWEPRRTRVLLVRAAVIAVGVFVLVLVLQAIFAAGIALAASLRGSTTGTGQSWARSVAGVAVRVGVAASAVALLGAAIASIGRHTAAALGAAFGYLAVVEGLLRGLVPSWAPNTLSGNIVIFVDGKPGNPGGGHSLISVEHGAITMAIYVAALLVVAVAFFRVRDVN
jgi:ABC-type transport system involved in multi-copper enzyme maturation permease subunit